MNQKIIETFDLSKTYALKGKQSIRALDNVNISLKKGEIYGLLGPNGAGKTTLIQILSTLLQPTSGYALIDGYNIVKDPFNAKKRICLMLGSEMLYYRMTAYNNLKFFCKIYKVSYKKERIIKHAKEFGLENWLYQYVEKLSSGMKTKLAICRTFLLNRPILFLDEPTLGLDASLKKYMIEKIKGLNRTIIISSHDMDVIEKVCDKIAFIRKGKIIKIGKKESLTEFANSEIKFRLTILENKDQLKNELKTKDFITEIEDIKNSSLIISINKRTDLNRLLSILGGYKVTHLNEYTQSLEDLFIRLNK